MFKIQLNQSWGAKSFSVYSKLIVTRIKKLETGVRCERRVENIMGQESEIGDHRKYYGTRVRNR